MHTRTCTHAFTHTHTQTHTLTRVHALALQEGARWSPEDYLVYLPAAHVHFGPQKPKINEPPVARPPGVRSLAETVLALDAAGGADGPYPPPAPPAQRAEHSTLPALLPPAPAPPQPSSATNRGVAKRVGVRARQPRKPRSRPLSVLSDTETTEEEVIDDDSEVGGVGREGRFRWGEGRSCCSQCGVRWDGLGCLLAASVLAGACVPGRPACVQWFVAGKGLVLAQGPVLCQA